MSPQTQLCSTLLYRHGFRFTSSVAAFRPIILAFRVSEEVIETSSKNFTSLFWKKGLNFLFQILVKLEAFFLEKRPGYEKFTRFIDTYGSLRQNFGQTPKKPARDRKTFAGPTKIRPNFFKVKTSQKRIK